MPQSAARSQVDLPYWDSYLRQLAQQPGDWNAEALHSHYGCWDNPAWSNRRPEDYGRAAERMCQRVLAAAEIQDGQRVLDVGCGLGSVVASLNARHNRMTLVGVNIDPRQLAIAHKLVAPRGANRVAFLAGNAVALPTADASFDRVLALECSMHFPSRRKFLQEARRVLRGGGRLALCEHVARRDRPEPADLPRQSRLWGMFHEPWSAPQWERLAAAERLRLIARDDVTRATIPTFPGVRKFVTGGLTGPLRWQASAMLWLTEALVRLGALRYEIMAFEAVD